MDSIDFLLGEVVAGDSDDDRHIGARTSSLLSPSSLGGNPPVDGKVGLLKKRG